MPTSPRRRDQIWEPLRRRCRLLLLLTELSDGNRWVDGDRLIVELADAYAWPLTPQQFETEWSSSAPLRKRTRKMLHEDIELLRPLGFAIEEEPAEPSAPPSGDAALKSNATYRFRLEPAPLVPVPLTGQNVQRVIQLVAAERSGVDVPLAAQRFSEALQAGVQVRCRARSDSGEGSLDDDQHVVDGDPVHLVLRDGGSWLALVRGAGDQRLWTLRLGRGYDIEVLSTPASPPGGVVPGRALDPMTWGSGTGLTLAVRVTSAALGRALDVLGPAVQDCRQLGADGYELDLWVTDARLLLARLTTLRTSVTLPDPQWRLRLREHLAALLAPADWLPETDARFRPVTEVPAEADDSLVQWSAVSSGLRSLARPNARGSGLVGLTLLALALVDDGKQWSAVDLAARLRTDVGTLQQALTNYCAAETDVFDSLPSLAAQVSPLMLTYSSGRLITVQQGPSSSRSALLGRPIVSPEIVLAACATAAEQVADPSTEPQQAADLSAFIDEAQRALGLRFTAEPPRADPGTGTGSGTSAVPLPIVVAALQHSRSGEYLGASANQPLAEGLAVGGRPLHALTYVDPWTGEKSHRVCVLLGLREQGPRRLLDVLDVERSGTSATDGSPLVRTTAPAVRTLLVNHVLQLEPRGGQRYPLSDAEFEQYARSAAEPVMVRIAVRPTDDPGPRATLQRGWRAQLLTERESGQLVADVTLHPPAAERALDLVAMWPANLRVVQPAWAAAAVQERVQDLLEHHADQNDDLKEHH